MSQKIINGAGSIKELGKILADLSCSKYLLVKDSSYNFLSIKDDIDSIGIPRVDFSDFTPNPLYEAVKKGVDLFNAEKCQAIVAVGGGSTMDVAKCIKLYCRMNPEINYLQQKYTDSGVPLIAIPTTAGTGSESTRYAVIYYEGKKQSVTHESIIPSYAILDSRVLRTLPLYQKKCTMLDALCQGIESWWSVNSNEESKGYSKIAVTTIMKCLDDYIFRNDDDAAENIMMAANYAGRAICITQTTAAHAMSYKITSMYKLPHGHAVAVCLPDVWQYMLGHPENCIDDRGADYLNAVFQDISSAMGAKNPQDAISIFRNLLERLEMQNPVATDRHGELKILANSVNPIRLKNNPVFLTSETLLTLYENIVK